MTAPALPAAGRVRLHAACASDASVLTGGGCLSRAAGATQDPVMNFFGLKAEDAPVVMGFEMASNKKFRLREEKLT